MAIKRPAKKYEDDPPVVPDFEPGYTGTYQEPEYEAPREYPDTAYYSGEDTPYVPGQGPQSEQWDEPSLWDRAVETAKVTTIPGQAYRTFVEKKSPTDISGTLIEDLDRPGAAARGFIEAGYRGATESKSQRRRFGSPDSLQYGETGLQINPETGLEWTSNPTEATWQPPPDPAEAAWDAFQNPQKYGTRQLLERAERNGRLDPAALEDVNTAIALIGDILIDPTNLPFLDPIDAVRLFSRGVNGLVDATKIIPPPGELGRRAAQFGGTFNVDDAGSIHLPLGNHGGKTTPEIIEQIQTITPEVGDGWVDELLNSHMQTTDPLPFNYHGPDPLRTALNKAASIAVGTVRSNAPLAEELHGLTVAAYDWVRFYDQTRDVANSLFLKALKQAFPDDFWRGGASMVDQVKGVIDADTAFVEGSEELWGTFPHVMEHPTWYDLTDDQAAVIGDIKRYLDRDARGLQKGGIKIDLVEDYVPHLYVKNGKVGTLEPDVPINAGGVTHSRAYPTLDDAKVANPNLAIVTDPAELLRFRTNKTRDLGVNAIFNRFTERYGKKVDYTAEQAAFLGLRKSLQRKLRNTSRALDRSAGVIPEREYLEKQALLALDAIEERLGKLAAREMTEADIGVNDAYVKAADKAYAETEKILQKIEALKNTPPTPPTTPSSLSIDGVKQAMRQAADDGLSFPEFVKTSAVSSKGWGTTKLRKLWKAAMTEPRESPIGTATSPVTAKPRKPAPAAPKTPVAEAAPPPAPTPTAPPTVSGAERVSQKIPAENSIRPLAKPKEIPPEIMGLPEKLRGTKPHVGRGQDALYKVEEAGIEIDDAQGLLEDFRDLARSDYDDAEEYASDRADAWDDFLDAFDEVLRNHQRPPAIGPDRFKELQRMAGVAPESVPASTATAPTPPAAGSPPTPPSRPAAPPPPAQPPSAATKHAEKVHEAQLQALHDEYIVALAKYNQAAGINSTDDLQKLRGQWQEAVFHTGRRQKEAAKAVDRTMSAHDRAIELLNRQEAFKERLGTMQGTLTRKPPAGYRTGGHTSSHPAITTTVHALDEDSHEVLKQMSKLGSTQATNRLLKAATYARQVSFGIDIGFAPIHVMNTALNDPFIFLRSLPEAAVNTFRHYDDVVANYLTHDIMKPDAGSNLYGTAGSTEVLMGARNTKFIIGGLVNGFEWWQDMQFGRFLNFLRIEMTKRHYDINIARGDAGDVAATQAWQTTNRVMPLHDAPRAGVHVARQVFDQLVWNSTSFLRQPYHNVHAASTGFGKMIGSTFFPGKIPPPTSTERDAVWQLAQMPINIMLLGAGTYAIKGQSYDATKDFGKFYLPWKDEPSNIGGPMVGWLRSVVPQRTNEKDADGNDVWTNPLIELGMNLGYKANILIVGATQTAVNKDTFREEEIWDEVWKAPIEGVIRAGPPAIQGAANQLRPHVFGRTGIEALEAAKRGDYAFAKDRVAELPWAEAMEAFSTQFFLAANATTTSKRLGKIRDTVAMEKFNAPYGQIGDNNQQREVENDPAVAELRRRYADEQDYSARMGNQFAQFMRDSRVVGEDHQKTVEELDAKLRSGEKDPYEWRKEWNEAQLVKRTVVKQLQEKTYADVIEKLNKKQGTPEQQAMNEYYKLYDKAYDPKTNEIDYDRFDVLEGEFLAGITDPAIHKMLIDNKATTGTPLRQQYRKDQERIQTYRNLGVTYAAKVPQWSQLPDAEAKINAMADGPQKTRAKEAWAKSPVVRSWKKLTSEAQDAMVLNDPAFRNLLYKWYPRDDNLQSLIKKGWKPPKPTY